MVAFKIFLLLSLIFSDVYMVFYLLKYTSSGDARHAEQAKMQFVFSVILTIISMIALGVTYIYSGLDIENYTTFTWASIYLIIGVSALILFCIFTLFCLKLALKIFKNEAQNEMYLSALHILLIVIFISFIALVVTIQFFLIYVNFIIYFG